MIMINVYHASDTIMITTKLQKDGYNKVVVVCRRGS